MRLCRFIPASLMPALVFTLTACSTTGSLQGNPAEMKIHLLSESEIKKTFGSTSIENPFLPHSGMFSGVKESFYVIALETSGYPLSVQLHDWKLVSLDGETARLLAEKDLLDYWEFRMLEPLDSATRRKSDKKYDAIIRSVLSPGTVREVKAGRPGIIVFSGSVPAFEKFAIELVLTVEEEIITTRLEGASPITQ